MANREFVEHELYLVKEWESADGKQAYRIRVVAFGEKPGVPMLEKREYYFDKETGDQKMGKRCGMTYEDFEAVMVDAEEIGQTLAKFLTTKK